MKEESNSAWIDEVIKQHKKQLEELKRVKEHKEENPFRVKHSNESINTNQNNTITSATITKSPNYQAIQLDNPSKLQAKINELTTKLSVKKEKIFTLKQQNSSLIEDNDNLKSQLIKLNNTNPSNEYNKTISQLNQSIKDLEADLEKKEVKINQMSITKIQELDLMNQKIRDFEVIIDENSSNYISNMNKLNKAIEEYKLRIIEADKYVSVVNFFIQKIDSLYGNEQKEIYDYKELQNKFVEIEKIIVANNLQYNSSKDRNKVSLIQSLPQFQNNVLKSISGMKPNAYDDNTIRGYEDSKLQEEDLVAGEGENDIQKNSLIYKTLEERVNELENEMRKNPHIVKRKKDKTTLLNNSNSLILNNQQESKERSRSMSKGLIINNDTICTNRKTEVCSAHKKIKKKKKKTKGVNTKDNNTHLQQGKKIKGKYD